MSNRRADIHRRIAAKTRTVGECHEWTGGTSGEGRGGGYPRVWVSGQMVAAHRVVYTHHFGYIPHRSQIDHTCNNRLCLNPAHLELITHAENQKRRADRAKRKD